ncbi:hypothetical protein CYMTET_22081 [Cymbomonas tetramitiformis]|uniref:EF-hand domain-containing protein n=1 Tax=Cymbomonas tetramitiformis TaxID=36881 RepID=A0AAE0L2J6_9CHLO|nr:hypothetical protein CYMTET_22081 [Cymbomonas tetramitiformis]|eukprot:gene21196-25462_t
MSEPAELEAICREAFSKYDKNKNGAIERDELTDVLADLGALKDVPKPSIGSFVIDMFGKIDLDKDSHINYQEFSLFYKAAVRDNQTKAAGKVDTGSPLQDVFVTFASYGAKAGTRAKEMEGKNFAKFSKDCGLLHKKKLTPTDIDLIFAKIKTKGARKINFDEFCRGLSLCADKLGTPYEQVVESVTSAEGPSSSATKAEAVKFHDDKSLYTGVHAKGGPTNFDGSDLSLRGSKQPGSWQ